jgi:estrone sulfotransferase
MAEEDSTKHLWEVGKEFPLTKVDYALPEFRKFITERKFKLIHAKHPENFDRPYTCVDLDGYNYFDAALPGYIWSTKVHEVHDDDIITASFPKTGTTWVQEIVWILTNNFDYDTAKKIDLNLRSPIMEISRPARAALEIQKRPHQYHYHAPYPLLAKEILDKKIKVIYVTRNPKDACVSLLHFYKFIDWFQYRGDLNEFARMFMNDEVMFAPYDKHILSYWEHRDDGHILFVTYEELKQDLRGGIKKIAAFLGVSITDEQLHKLAEHTSFGSMAKLNTVNREEFYTGLGVKDAEGEKFMRKGIIGDWKNNFDKETNEEFDKWIAERFDNTGINFIYE